ncbi:MAG: T9SS type A sorting domain-containing protein, partial [Spirosomaceae bacterium]|nr:T9SS type A sorting domain-containing protein [Spirosomataceae bacterium]
IVGYQWQKRVGTSGSFVDMLNETNATLNLSNVNSADNNTYYKCRITFSSSSGTCSRLTDDARLTVTSPNIPTLMGTTTICQGEAALLTASGCGGGTVLWSDGRTTTSISVSPEVNTDYTAQCKIGDCLSGVSDKVTVTVRAGINPPINTTPASVDAPAVLVFSATPTVANATLHWYTTVSGGTSTTVAPQYATPNTYTHWVSQKDPVSGCESPRTQVVATIVNAFRITTQPFTQGDCKGNSVYFDINTAGGTNVTYQWQRKRPNESDFTDIPDGNVKTYRVSNVGSTDNPHLTEYRCYARSGNTVLFSSQVTLKVNSVTGNLPNLGACLGKSFDYDLDRFFTIVGTVSEYQWQTRQGTSGPWTNLVDGNGIVGSKTKKLEFTNPIYEHSAYYRCAIKFVTEGNVCIENTDNSKLSVSGYPPPPNTTQEFEYCRYEKASKLVTFNQNRDLDVLWYTTPTGGVASTSAPTPSTDVDGEFYYYATQRTIEGCESQSRIAIKIKVNPLTPMPINKTPASVEEGSPFTMIAEGQNLRWYRTATTTTGSSQAPTFTAVGAYSYYVTQTVNGCESNRLVINFSITPILKITKQPLSQADCEGNSVTISITATGRTSVLYQWQRKLPNAEFVDIIGQNSASLKIDNVGGVANPNGTQYRCVVKDNTNSIISEVATLTVNSIRGTIPNVALCSGSTTILNLDSLKFTGTVVGYQWLRSMAGSYRDLAEETNKTLTINEAGSYRCKVIFRIDDKNTCSENSPIVTATVRPTPLSPKVSEVNYCLNQPAKQLTATADSGNSLVWYSSSTDTKAINTPTPKTDLVGKYSFFVSQKNQFGCEGPRAELVVIVYPKPNAPATTSEINYCRNATTETLKATTDIQNNLLWYTTSSAGNASTTAPKPDSSTDTTINYFVSAVNANGCESSIVPIKVIVSPCIANVSDACLQISAENVSGNRWFDIFDSNGNLYASVNPNGQNLGRVTLSIRKYQAVPVSANGTRILQRFLDFQSSVTNLFEKPVSVRVYHTNTELEAYKSASSQPNLTINDLKIIHYDGIREDCDWFNDDNFENGQAFLIYRNITARQLTNSFFYLQFDVNSFSEIAATSNVMTETVEFNAQKKDNVAVDLDWITNLELRALKFKVQRSKDGLKWATIAEPPAKGVPSTYNLTDYLPLAGKSFYRLIYVDRDGVQKILDPIEIIFDTPEPVCKIVPNPVVDDKELKLYLRNIQPKEIRLYNQKGQEWGIEISSDQTDLIKIRPNSALSQGVYYMNVKDGDKKCLQRFTVIK